MKKTLVWFGLVLIANTGLALPASARPAGFGRPDFDRPIERPADFPDRPIDQQNWQRDNFDRPVINQPINNRPIDSNNTIINNRPVNINNINTRPNWVNPNWGGSRPWGGYGWYGGWSNPPWGWWGANAALWGITSLTSAAIIGNSINNAISNDVTYVSVPNSAYNLYYGTVLPLDNSQVQFAFGYQGQTYQALADCQQGWLNGQPPNTPADAELMNAACQVAFSNF
ncbi:hypothetical protein [Synechococcus elongatus]|uniref:Uncharacterized protein n=1 Tax=Synechococcus elongatus PCC 11801 TaxID=2219813 RepID=A0AAN1QP51_SYNEL|nr:hypothetical protein [Synechococcus elongatus]AZB72764.1 hypothetical protein DOP62_08610 [Synechococcus elongatus PCC 11801]